MFNLTIKNIGMIKQAKIALNGLTVIAGENDTGKSTVGKLMFAIVKALNRFEQDLNEDKTNYYLAAPTKDHLTEIIDVTDDLNQIFQTLSKPLQKLVWR
jgi:predicted ATPase